MGYWRSSLPGEFWETILASYVLLELKQLVTEKIYTIGGGDFCTYIDSKEGKKELLESFYQRILSKGNYSVVEKMFLYGICSTFFDDYVKRLSLKSKKEQVKIPTQ